MSELVAKFNAEQLRDLASLDGLYVGILGKEDGRLFEDAEEAGLAYRSFEGPAAMLGLSKVRIGRRP